MRCVRLPIAIALALSLVPRLAAAEVATAALPAPAGQSIQSDGTLLSFVLTDLTQRKQALAKKPVKVAKGQATPVSTEAAWLEALSAHYAAPQSAMAWVDRNGLAPRTQAAIDEMLGAGDYGLEPAKFGIPVWTAGQTDLRALAKTEVDFSLAILRYALHARGGRFNPTELSLWLDYNPRIVNPSALITDLSKSADIAGALRAMHPSHPQFEALRQALLAERRPVTVSPGQDVIAMGAPIKPGQRHPDVALVRQRLSKPADAGNETLLDRDLMDAVAEFMSDTGIPFGRRRGIDDDVRQALNGERKEGAKGNKARINLILANMERWRWLPRDFGDLYIWNNLPEFETRVVKSGSIIHAERIIIGEAQSQTPVFSDTMTRVIFKPDWNVPESIKLSSLWGSLRGGDFDILGRRNMRIIHQGREIKPQKIKWATVNARDVPIVQGPGSGNPLGDFKFVFPNKHDVYMHDTTSRHLFSANARTFSHGCIRVRNPQRFAEVILAEGKNWNKADVAWQARTKSTVRIELDRSIPIHNTYFTLVADANGALKPFRDMYGHDKRIIDALTGVDPKRIGASDPALALKQRNEQLALAAPVPSKPDTLPPKPFSIFGFKPAPVAPIRPGRRQRPSYDQPPPPPGYFMTRQGIYRTSPPRGSYYVR